MMKDEMPTIENLRDALRPIIDPELGVSIVGLGLVRELTREADGTVAVVMTLTTPACPRYDFFRDEVTTALKALSGVDDVAITFTFDPPWAIEQASDDIKMELALKGVVSSSW